MTPLDEFEIHPQTGGNTDRSEEAVALGPGDFRRIGIRPKETRLDVIRRAASRAAKSLARRQLSAPNPLTEHQLSRIAISTYRLLDPRQREDRRARVHIGRIRPGILHHTGRASFADGAGLAETTGVLEANDPAAPHHISQFSSAAIAERPLIDSLNDEKAESDTVFLLTNRRTSFLTRLRHQTQRPSMIIAMMVVLLISAAALWIWGQHLQSVHQRLVPVSTDSRPEF